MFNTKTKKIILTIIIAALVAGGAFAYYGRQKDDQTTTNPEQGLVDNSPPSDEERQSGDQQKQENLDKERAQTSDNSANKTASVIITDAGQYDDIIEVRAFIPDHYQDGTCTIIFTKGTQTLTKSTPAYRDASTTICTNPLIKRTEFPSTGDWQLRVAYKSKDAIGTSATKIVQIK